MTDSKSTATLDPDFLALAYRSGYFPMANSKNGTISWYSPDPRAVIPLTTFRVSRSLRRVIRKGEFEVRVDTSFAEVIRGCAEREDTWISDEIVRAYCGMYEKGLAHSVETWSGSNLVGGLYGVAIGGAFFGESMFSRVSGASKVALVHLASRLKERGFVLLDTQFMNPHVRQFGAREIPRARYLQELAHAISLNAEFL